MSKQLFLFIASLFLTVSVLSQSDSLQIAEEYIELKGVVFDSKTKQVLPYVNISILKNNKGTVTNELGAFMLIASDINATDTIRFQFIGFKTKNVTISEIQSSSEIFLEEDLFSIDEVFVLSNRPDPEDIVKKILKNREENYKIEPRKEQTFLRERYLADLEEFQIDYKKSTIEDLNKDMIGSFQEKVPKHTTSYTDFLGKVYLNIDSVGKKSMKIDPIKKVKLKSKELTDMKQFEVVFEDLINNTEDKEYWKIKTGIFSEKIELDEDDSIHELGEQKNTDNIKDFKNSLLNLRKYSTFKDKDLWDFLYKTNSYEFSFEGGTTIGNEDAYIIDFVPKKRGLYMGRLYVATKSFALLRADYKFAPNKTGRDIHLLGFSYEHTYFSGSIYFEKKGKNYVLKYFSHKKIETYGVERNLAFQKKKKRFLFDKKLQELKIGLDLKIKSQVLIEYLALDSNLISDETYDAFDEQEQMNVIYVDKFDESLWKGYSIIEPTKQMRDYIKTK